MVPSKEYLSGEALWGDDLPLKGLEDWYASEKSGYYDLATKYYSDGASFHETENYEYEALNHLHAFGYVEARHWDTCVALGCATGADVAPLSKAVDRYIAIEPAEKWWRSEIGGKPAEFFAPDIQGTMPVASETADLFVSLGVLHHIPNVSHVLRESARVLRKGGLLVLREPISSMGRWWEPRAGLTPNERGLPEGWLRRALRNSGYSVLRWRHCMFSPLSVLSGKLKLSSPYRYRSFCLADWMFSEATAFNSTYYRPSFARKFAPGSVFVLARKTD